MPHRALRENLHRALSAYVAAHPARTDAPPEVHIVFGNSHQEILVVEPLAAPPMPAPAPSANGDDDDDELGPVDEVILEVVRAMNPKQILPATEIAHRAGYKCAGWFKARIARLGRLGLIIRAKGRGYGPLP